MKTGKAEDWAEAVAWELEYDDGAVCIGEVIDVGAAGETGVRGPGVVRRPLVPGDSIGGTNRGSRTSICNDEVDCCGGKTRDA